MHEIEKFSAGDRVVYSYIHNLSSKSTTIIIKHGVFLQLVNHTTGYKGEQLTLVHFDGNKSQSKVKLSKLKIIKKLMGE